MSIKKLFLIFLILFDIERNKLEFENKLFLLRYIENQVINIFPKLSFQKKSVCDKKDKLKRKINNKNYCSLPFSIILEKSVRSFPKNKNLTQANNLIEKFQKMGINEVSDYFSQLKIKNINDYWYYFYILTNVAMKGKKINNQEKNKNAFPYINYFKKTEYIDWNFENSYYDQNISINKDNFYEEIKVRDAEYQKKLEICKKNSMRELKLKLLFNNNFNFGVSKFNNNDNFNLNFFRQTLFLRKMIKTLAFYKIIENKLPKGILTHIHWPAAFTGKSIYNAILKGIDDKKKINKVDGNYAVVKINLLRISKINSNKYVDIPSPFYFIIDNLKDFKYRILLLAKKEKEFLKQYISKNKECLAFPKDGKKKEISDMNIRAFFYFKYCKKSKIFVDFDFSNENTLKEIFNGLLIIKRIKRKIYSINSQYFKNSLEISRYFNEEKETLIKNFLPRIYSNHMNLNENERLESAIWFKFENIFLEFENLIYHRDVFKILNQHLRKNLIKQKIFGVEIRIFNQGNVVSEMNDILLNLTSSSDIYNPQKNEKLKVGYIFYGVKSKISSCTKEILQNNNVFQKFKIDINENYNISKIPIKDKSPNKDLIQSHNNSINLIGIDYVGFEDDPFTGARNFFYYGTHNDTENNSTPHKKKDFPINDNDYENYFEMLFNNLKNNSDLPLFYHAGETKYFPDCPIDDDYMKNNYINDNLFHALLLPNVKRIGHGFAAIKNKLLLEILRKKNIALEFSPISNQDLFYYNVEENPMLNLIKLGFPITINSDDPGFFGYEGVTMDWLYLIMQSDLKPSDMYLLIKNSLVYSGIKLKKIEYEDLLRITQKDFLHFLEALECKK